MGSQPKKARLSHQFLIIISTDIALYTLLAPPLQNLIRAKLQFQQILKQKQNAEQQKKISNPGHFISSYDTHNIANGVCSRDCCLSVALSAKACRHVWLLVDQQLDDFDLSLLYFREYGFGIYIDINCFVSLYNVFCLFFKHLMWRSPI